MERGGLDVLQVLGARRPAAENDLQKIASSRGGVYYQSIAGVLLDDERFCRIGVAPIPISPFPIFRRRFFGGWLLLFGNGSEKFVKVLTEEQSLFPIEVGIPADTLVQRLATDWTPVHDRGDLLAKLKKVAGGPPTSGFDAITFFLDFPNDDAATIAVEELCKLDFEASLTAPDEDGLKEVRAKHELGQTSESAFASLESTVSAIAAARSGTITGHEFGYLDDKE